MTQGKLNGTEHATMIALTRSFWIKLNMGSARSKLKGGAAAAL